MVGEIVNRTVRIGAFVIEPQSFTKEIVNFARYIDGTLVSIEDVNQVLEIKTLETLVYRMDLV